MGKDTARRVWKRRTVREKRRRERRGLLRGVGRKTMRRRRGFIHRYIVYTFSEEEKKSVFEETDGIDYKIFQSTHY